MTGVVGAWDCGGSEHSEVVRLADDIQQAEAVYRAATRNSDRLQYLQGDTSCAASILACPRNTHSLHPSERGTGPARQLQIAFRLFRAHYCPRFPPLVRSRQGAVTSIVTYVTLGDRDIMMATREDLKAKLRRVVWRPGSCGNMCSRILRGRYLWIPQMHEHTRGQQI